MARRTPRIEEPDQELNLAPIMNMVIILIPLLLLSVVFLKVGVINVSTPSLTVGDKTEPPEDIPQKLTVAISSQGFIVGTRDGILPGRGACANTDVTVCLSDQSADVRGAFMQAQKLSSAGQLTQAEGVLDEALAHYDWASLYNTLSLLKKANPEETKIYVSADADIPYAAVIRLFDVARVKLEKDSYDSATAFWSAQQARDGRLAEQLFGDPVLAIAR